VQPQEIDDRILDVGRRNRYRLIDDVAVAAFLAHRGDAQGIALVALGERHDRLGHGGGKEERAALARGRVEDFLEVLAKAHVEHLVRLVEDGDAQGRQVQRAALQVIAQTSRRADHDMGALRQRAALLGRVHASHARS
jgi:hypothetical protein